MPVQAYWPDMIKPDQAPTDMIHLIDFFTTEARLEGALDQIPNNREIDGIDHTAVLLLGEGHGRRDYMTYYSAGTLAAFHFEDFKVHIKPAQGGFPGMEFYNVRSDPEGKCGALYQGLFAVTPIKKFIGSHMEMIRKFPHRDPSEPTAFK